MLEWNLFYTYVKNQCLQKKRPKDIITVNLNELEDVRSHCYIEDLI